MLEIHIQITQKKSSPLINYDRFFCRAGTLVDLKSKEIKSPFNSMIVSYKAFRMQEFESIWRQLIMFKSAPFVKVFQKRLKVPRLALLKYFLTISTFLHMTVCVYDYWVLRANVNKCLYPQFGIEILWQFWSSTSS